MNTQTNRTYGAYGNNAGTLGRARTAYAGEVNETDIGWYMLGERLYSCTLRRFIAPDRLSPFDRGGINRYAYCGGDPMNRVDPSGRTWLRWLAASQGLTGNPGASRHVATDSGNEGASTATPGMVNSTAAAIVDTVSITAAIGSAASTASTRPKAEGLFGWLAMGSTSASSALPAARTGPPQARFVSQQVERVKPMAGKKSPVGNVTLLIDHQVPGGRLKFTRAGNVRLRMNWMNIAHSSNSESSIIAADTTIKGQQLAEVMRLLAQAGVRKANVYTGGHGNPLGDNWNHLGNRYPGMAVSKFAAEDAAFQLQARKLGVKLNLINLTDINLSEFERRLAQDGVHIIAHCFGVADPAVMKALNLSHVFTYDLTPVP